MKPTGRCELALLKSGGEGYNKRVEWTLNVPSSGDERFITSCISNNKVGRLMGRSDFLWIGARRFWRSGVNAWLCKSGVRWGCEDAILPLVGQAACCCCGFLCAASSPAHHNFLVPS